MRTENCDVDDTDLLATQYNDGKESAALYYDDLIVYRGKPWRTMGGDCDCSGPGPVNVFSASPDLSLYTAKPVCN